MEKRQFNRITFMAQAQLRQGERSWDTQIFDLSLKGALIQYPTDFEGDLHEQFHLEFRLEGVQLFIKPTGHIAHNNNHRLGFCIDHIDIDSVTQLKRLVALNLGDEELLGRDIKALTECAE